MSMRTRQGAAPNSTAFAFRRRLQLCGILALAPALPISIRLAYLHVVEGSQLKGIAVREWEREKEEPMLRGRFLDARGRVLAESLPAWSAYADPSTVRSAWTDAKRLAPILDVPEPELRSKLRGRGRFVWLKRKLDMAQAREVRGLDLPGVGLVIEEERHYPNGSLARNVLGEVGVDGSGLSGLERTFHKDLNGDSRRLTVLLDGTGVPIQRRDEADARPPKDVQLTIDASMQYFAEQALGKAVEKYKAHGGMVLIQDPLTGEILAMASTPDDPLKNPDVQQAFEPGSTMKFLTAVAALEEKAVRTDETFDTENGKWEPFPGVVIRDHKSYPKLTLAGIIENSSNIGIAKVAQRLGAKVFCRYAELFGLGLKTGVGFPGESAGSLPRPEHMREINLLTASYGYGVALSAIQLVTAYSAIGNGGTLFQPKLVRAVRAQDGTVVRADPPARIRRVASPETLELVRSMLLGVVEQGTGKEAEVPGYLVAGKTGTSKKLDSDRKYSSQNYMASFCGLVPADRPRFTILVVLDSPQGEYYGGEVAAPVFAEIARNVLVYDGTPKQSPAPAGMAR
jgi:cell division protein FtsI/penicillin-binding protein 2